MNEKINKNVKVEKLTRMFLSRGEGKGLIVKDPWLVGCGLTSNSAIYQQYSDSVWGKTWIFHIYVEL